MLRTNKYFCNSKFQNHFRPIEDHLKSVPYIFKYFNKIILTNFFLKRKLTAYFIYPIITVSKYQEFLKFCLLIE